MTYFHKWWDLYLTDSITWRDNGSLAHHKNVHAPKKAPKNATIPQKGVDNVISPPLAGCTALSLEIISPLTPPRSRAEG
jgi:hypothetical protein